MCFILKFILNKQNALPKSQPKKHPEWGVFCLSIPLQMQKKFLYKNLSPFAPAVHL